MKKRCLLPGLIIIFTGFLSTAQEVDVTDEIYPRKDYFNLDFTAGSNEFAGSVSWSHLFGLGQKEKFKIGYGLRGTSYFGTNKNFITAPARLAGVIDPMGDPAKKDTLFINRPQANFVNLMINLQYSFNNRMDLGFNIDALGFTFGEKKTGRFISTLRPEGEPIEQTASLTTFNMLIMANYDRGSLNSQLYYRYWFSEEIAAKASVGMLFVEYTTDQVLTFNNDRFRHKAMPMFSLGVSISPL